MFAKRKITRDIKINWNHREREYFQKDFFFSNLQTRIFLQREEKKEFIELVIQDALLSSDSFRR